MGFIFPWLSSTVFQCFVLFLTVWIWLSHAVAHDKFGDKKDFGASASLLALCFVLIGAGVGVLPQMLSDDGGLPSLVFSVIKEWAFTKRLWSLITSTTAFHGCVNVSFSLKILKYINSSQSRMKPSSEYEASFESLPQLLIIRWIRGHSNVFCVASLKSDTTTQNPQPAGTPCLQETTEKPRPH